MNPLRCHATALLALALGPLTLVLLVPGQAAEPVAPAPEALAEAPAPTLQERREAAQARYLRLMDEGRPAEAVPVAVEIVELTRQQLALEGTGDGIALAGPLNNLATAQARAGDLLAAESNYLAAVTVIEKAEGILAPRLLNSLNGLGDTYLRAGRHDQAAETYERALRVSQVSEGLYHGGQFPIRDALSESYLGGEDLEQANFHQKFQVYAETRRLGADNPGVAPALSKLGAWYLRTGQPEQARMAYQQAERIISEGEGPDAPALVDAALAIAGTYRQQALEPANPSANESPLAYLPLAITTLRRALALEDRQPRPDPARRARILVELGDIQLMLNRSNVALESYRAAWSGLSADPALATLRDDYFQNPVPIAGPPLPAVHPRKLRKQPDQAREPGYILIRYAVDERGRVDAAAVVESDPAGLLDQEALAALRGNLFRPRFVAGAPTRADNLLRRHEFRYRATESRPAPPETEDEPLQEPGAAPAAVQVPQPP